MGTQINTTAVFDKKAERIDIVANIRIKLAFIEPDLPSNTPKIASIVPNSSSIFAMG